MVDPWLAFSADNVVIPGLSEGIVFPEKDEGALQGCLFKNKSQAKELFAETRVSKERVLVRVLVGTKDGIEKWLRISGPASCALWIEISENKLQFSTEGLVTGQLRLAYRLRSHSASYLTVLRGAFLILSSYHRSRFELRSPRHREKGSENPLCKWLLLMSAGAFRQLLCMIEPGGLLAEFQTLLRQLVDSPNFLDVDFRHLDLPCWLSRYPFVLSLDGFDLLVLTRDMKWTILRFDCLEGLMKIAKGDDFSGADEGDSEDSLQSTLKDMDPGKLFQVHDWNLWEEVSMQKDARRIGPLGAIIFNNFYMDGKGFVGGVAVQESLDCVVKSWKESEMKVKYVFCISGATIFELKAGNMFPRVQLSMEEQSALSTLQSSCRADRQQGLDILIELLLGDMSENATENSLGLAARTSFRGIVSSARDAIINWNTFYEINSDGFQVSSDKPAFGAQRMGWMRLLEWSDRNFFEALLDEAMLVSDSAHELGMHKALLKVLDIIPGEASSRFSAISIAHLKDCVRKIQHLVNAREVKDLKWRTFSSILDNEGHKKHLYRQIVDAEDEDTVEQKEIRHCKPVEIFHELHCMSKILSLVAHGSSVVPAVVAECEGASLALETFLDLVGIFSVKSTGCTTDVADGSVLPGEVVENEGAFLKICPLVRAEISQSLSENSLRNSSSQCSAVELAFPPDLAFTSSRINAMLQAQRKGYDQSNIKKTFHSTGLAKVLMKLILRKVGFASTVRGLSFSQSIDSDIGSINQKTAKMKLNPFPMKECVADYLPSDVVLSLATDAKYHLLSAAAAMLTNKSLALLEAKKALIKKFSGERRVQLVGSFLEELVQALHHGLSDKVQEHIFQILYILDKGEETNGQEKALTEAARLPAGSAMFSFIMLSEVGVQLKAALSQQNGGTLNRMESDGNQHEQVALAGDRWITVGSLLQVLTAFICKWPEKKAASLVFQCCGAQIETILHVLSLSGGPNAWSPGQLLAMQNVLRLFGTTMEHSSISDSPTQKEVDNFVWNIVIDNNDHWDFVKCYSHWIVFDACHECVWNLLEEYCWSVWEPLEVHDLLDPPLKIGNPSPSWLPRWLPSLQCEEIPLKNLVSFLRLIIGVIQRKVDMEKDGLNLLMPGKARLLLEFLMNPVNGLLMKLLKGDSFQKNRILPLKDAYFHLKHVREDLRNLIPFCTQRQVICRIPDQASPKGEFSSFNRRYRGRSSLCDGFTQASTISKHTTHFTAEGLANITYELAYLAATNVGIASLQLLASIFGLNFHEQKSSPKRLVTENPFLSRKYAYPFLDFHFLRFVQLYYVNFLQGQKVCNKAAEPPLEKVNENSCTVAWCADQDSTCSEADIRDEQVSLECAVHVQVLLALAQNQTEEVSVRFKQLRIMNFLVHQIALEYEVSQIATPRDVVRINKALASQLKSSSRNSGSHAKDVLKGQSSRGTAHQLDSAGDASPRISERSHPSLESSLGSSSITTPSLAGLKKGLSQLTVACSLHSPAEAGGSKRLCLGRKGVLGKHLRLMCKDIPKLELGFLSARNMGSVSHVESPCESYLLNRPFTGRHEFLLKWQEVMNPNVPKVPPVDEAWSRESGHQKSGEERKVAFPEELRQNILEEDNNKHSALAGLIECDIEDRYGDQQVEPEAKTKLVYSGRFFDLNEEVERELAEEDQDWQDDRTGDDSDQDTDETSGEDSDTSLHDNTVFQPLVPKLNLPRSARKGEQDSGSHSTSTATEAKSECPKIEKKSPGIPLSGDILTSGSSSKPLESTTPYELERSQRRLYRNSSLHLFLLELYITLMLTSQGTLEQSYSDRFQTEKQKLNAPFFLFYHLNHVANSYLLPCLAERMRNYHPSAFRILRLSWRGLFNPSLYKNRIRIAHGASAQIYKATFDDGNEENEPKLVVLKTVDLPKGPYEPCKFFDVYSEVQILEKFMGEPRVCQLLDYGVESETFVLVLKHYKCSLRAWRLNQGICLESTGQFSKASNLQKPFFERLPLYLEVYAAVLDAVKGLEMHNVVHYDLKCDNVLLEPIDPVLPEEEFWDPTWPPSDNSYHLPFKVCLTDFGQSKASIFQGGECTYRNRGTEYVKSPEMLKLLRTSSDIGVQQADESVGKAVDVWGLGCLLYELLAAEYLLYDEDWMHFFVRVTMQSEELITNEKAEKVGNFGPVVDFIRFVLVRDPSRRPTLDEVMIHLKQLQASLGGMQTPPSHELHVVSNMDSVCVPPATAFVCDKPSDSPEVKKPPKSFKREIASWLCCSCWGHHAVD